MKNFFLDIRNSFYSPSFYASGRGKPMNSAIGFLFFSSLLISFLMILGFTFAVIPGVLASKPAEFIQEKFPAELAVTITDGKASANVEQPFIVPIPEKDKLKDGEFENFLVIDTRPETTIAMLEDYKSIAVLTESSLYVSQDTGERRIIPLGEADYVTIDKECTLGLVEGLMAIVWIVIPVLLVFAAPFLALFGTGYFLVVSYVGAIIPLVISKIRKIPMTYWEAYKTALYGTVPIMIITTVWLFFSIGPFPMFLDVLLFAFLLTLNLKPPRSS